MFTIGLIINPVAGLGGRVALKGSDGVGTVEQALALGAIPRAEARTEVALRKLLPLKGQIRFLSWRDDMGGALLKRMGFVNHLLGNSDHKQTSPEDTEAAVVAMEQAGVDLILFAGGDGTARNICNRVSDAQPVLGIPSGVKIHSGVYAVTPSAAGQVVAMLIRGELVGLREQDVRDIDESAFREGRVRAKHYGDLLVPEEGRYVQQVKQAGREVEALVVQDIADYFRDEIMEDDVLYLVGPGSTTQGVMDVLGLENTLLGVDLICNATLIASDMSEQSILEHIKDKPVKLLVTAIGGQGHLFGRGNQQLSPDVIRMVGRENILVLATKTKIRELDGRPLLLDTGDTELDQALCGTMTVLTGYNDRILYPVTTL
ncbi:ATP-NAD kinase family protein [Kistimonas scapharcae]|uniref:ATP-NAD kinase family protein n=1 Tax=Kistimonas scapharcae TaxID=1036133 RepID=UPI003CD0B0F1